MTKLLSCRYNMDTNRVEARFEDGTTLAIDCIAVEDEYGNTPKQRQNLTGCSTISPWSTLSLCWRRDGALSLAGDATTAGWKIKSL